MRMDRTAENMCAGKTQTCARSVLQDPWVPAFNILSTWRNQTAMYLPFNVSTMETAKACKFFCRGRSISPTQDLEIHLRHELPCTCLLSCSWNMPKVPGDCYLSPQMELKLGLSPSNHFGKAKVHEEAEEKTTHNKCGCEAEVHVLQLAFHIMEPHTIKPGFLPNIPQGQHHWDLQDHRRAAILQVFWPQRSWLQAAFLAAPGRFSGTIPAPCSTKFGTSVCTGFASPSN